MPQVNCQKCSKVFYAKPSWLRNGHGKYCSNTCHHASQRNGSILKCSICDKQVYRSQKNQRRSLSGKFFCTKSCQTVWRNSQLFANENHPNWSSGQFSYRQRLLRSDAVQACAKCSTDDMRVMAVHHRDRNRLNNQVSNLVWLCHNCHYLVHHYKDEAKGFLVPVA